MFIACCRDRSCFQNHIAICALWPTRLHTAHAPTIEYSHSAHTRMPIDQKYNFCCLFNSKCLYDVYIFLFIFFVDLTQFHLSHAHRCSVFNLNLPPPHAINKHEIGFWNKTHFTSMRDSIYILPRLTTRGKDRERVRESTRTPFKLYRVTYLHALHKNRQHDFIEQLSGA